jgi:hypothetical protein
MQGLEPLWLGAWSANLNATDLIGWEEGKAYYQTKSALNSLLLQEKRQRTLRNKKILMIGRELCQPSPGRQGRRRQKRTEEEA